MIPTPRTAPRHGTVHTVHVLAYATLALFAATVFGTTGLSATILAGTNLATAVATALLTAAVGAVGGLHTAHHALGN